MRVRSAVAEHPVPGLEAGGVVVGAEQRGQPSSTQSAPVPHAVARTHLAGQRHGPEGRGAFGGADAARSCRPGRAGRSGPRALAQDERSGHRARPVRPPDCARAAWAGSPGSRCTSARRAPSARRCGQNDAMLLADLVQASAAWRDPFPQGQDRGRWRGCWPRPSPTRSRPSSRLPRRAPAPAAHRAGLARRQPTCPPPADEPIADACSRCTTAFEAMAALAGAGSQARAQGGGGRPVRPGDRRRSRPSCAGWSPASSGRARSTG